MSGATAVLIALLAQTASSGPPAENADFPRYDGAAWELQRAGLTVKAADRSLRRAPDAVETIELLLAAQRTGDALQVLRRIVDRHPERMARAFEIVSRAPGISLHDDGRDHQAVLQPIVEAAFGRLPALSREDAARAERMLMMVDRRKVPGRSFDDGLALFVEKYRGTEAAAQTELEMLTRRRGQERLDALDAFIRLHPDGLLGARALFEKGHYFSSTVGTSGVEPRNADPTGRFMKTVEIVKELQSGRYPASEWVDRAPTLVTGFYWSHPAFAEANLERVVEVFYASLATSGGTFSPHRYGGAEYLVTQRLPDLLEPSGAGVAGVERMLDCLERDTGDRAMADYLRVVLSLSRLNSRGYFYRGDRVQLSDEERTARIERTTRLLDALSRGESRYTRWALATLATFYFEQLDFSRARVRYQEYVTRFGASDYAWLAALRIGECAEGSGDLAGAVDAYRVASARRDAGALPMAIGHLAAARVFESQARLDLALAEYRRTLASWDNDYGREYLISTNLTAVGPRDDALDRRLSSTQLEVKQRVQRLTAAVASPPAALLERGNWLLEQRRWADARTEFERVSARYPGGAHVSAALYGARAARLRQALDRVKGSSPETALSELEAVTAQPYDTVVTLSAIARASILQLQGEITRADAIMKDALGRARDQQRARPAAPAQNALERDVAAIRSVIFKPRGGQPYQIVSSEVNVTLPDGEQATVPAVQPLPGLDNVLFLNGRELELLRSIAIAFRTSDPNPPQDPMYRLLAWWQTFFDAGPLAWGHLPVETHPVIRRLEFTSATRTQATARVSTGYSTGRAIVLRKVDGTWQVIRTGPEWVA